MRRRTAAPAVLLMAGLAACSSGVAGKTSSSSGASGTAAPGQGNKLVGIVSISANEYGNAHAIDGVAKAAKAAGWTVSVVDAQGSADKANAAIQNFAARKAGAIFDLVFPTTAVGGGLAAARSAGIPVATWGGGLGTGVVMTTGAGGPFAEPVVKQMLTDLGGKGAVLALTYHGGQVCRDREAVFDEQMKVDPGVKVTKNEVNIPGFEQDSQRYANAWLAGHPAGRGPLAVWGCWDGPALGASAGLRQSGRLGDVKAYGENGGPDGIAAVKAGTLTATVYEDSTKEGELMFTTTMQAMAAGSSWQPKNIDVPGTLVTKDTVPALLMAHPDALG